MNSYATVLHSLLFVSDSIFEGLKILFPLIFLFKLFPWYKNFKLPCIVLSANILLLSGSILFLIVITFNFFMTQYSGNESEKEFFISIITGPHWFQFVIPLINFAILPEILWIKKIRNSFFPSFIVIIWWHIWDFIMHSKMHQFSTVELAEKAGLFVILCAAVYFLVKRKKALPA
jgi:hypothetical protein